MNTKPESLRIADGLESHYSVSYIPYAAVEIRRLYAEIERLRTENDVLKDQLAALREATLGSHV